MCTDLLMEDGRRFDGSLGDNGLTITLDGVGQVAPTEQQEAAIDSRECILYGTETTDAVRSRIDATRALDGMQDVDHGPFAATWTYHPDAGIDLTVQERPDDPEWC